jgi:hypothetical protein
MDFTIAARAPMIKRIVERRHAPSIAHAGQPSIGRMTRHGLPAATIPSGTSRVTTLHAPTTARDPMVTPGRMIAPPRSRGVRDDQDEDRLSSGAPA